jgi:hypothetical protein
MESGRTKYAFVFTDSSLAEYFLTKFDGDYYGRRRLRFMNSIYRYQE